MKITDKAAKFDSILSLNCEPQKQLTEALQKRDVQFVEIEWSDEKIEEFAEYGSGSEEVRAEWVAKAIELRDAMLRDWEIIEDFLAELAADGYVYARQASEPWWYTQGDTPSDVAAETNDGNGPSYVSATSGSSPLNEWYAFASEDAGMEFFIDRLNGEASDSMKERFAVVGDEIFRAEDCAFDDGGDATPNDDAEPATLQELADADSVF